jgi:putative transcriptional regulator
MVVRKTTADRPYRYDLSGLDNVLLVGVEVRECQRCRAQVPVIPKIGQLHRAIAKYLVFKNGLLTGREIRFLRKNAGLSNKKFAALLEIDESHLSRVENGKIGSLGAATDKLARAFVEASTDGEARKFLLDIA